MREKEETQDRCEGDLVIKRLTVKLEECGEDFDVIAPSVETKWLCEI